MFHFVHQPVIKWSSKSTPNPLDRIFTCMHHAENMRLLQETGKIWDIQKHILGHNSVVNLQTRIGLKGNQSCYTPALAYVYQSITFVLNKGMLTLYSGIE